MKNLKKITLAVLALVSTATINAQENDSDKENNLRIGIKAGLNYSNVYDERGDDFVADGKFGLAGGAFLSIPIGELLGIQPEFLFSQKGFKATGSIVGLNYELTRTSTFIDVPLFFAVRPVSFITILAGPQFSYLINQKDEFTSSVSSFEVEQEFENDNIRKNIMCFVGGIDINVSHVVVGARAGFDFQDNAGDGTNSSPRYKNVWYQATVGFRF
jgi:hypothetical protein